MVEGGNSVPRLISWASAWIGIADGVEDGPESAALREDVAQVGGKPVGDVDQRMRWDAA